MEIDYPEPPRDGRVVETIHGQEVEDVFRGMEEVGSDATKKWVSEECELWKRYSEQKGMQEAQVLFEARMKEAWNYDKVGLLRKHGEKFYFMKKSGLENQYVLYACEEATSESMDKAVAVLNLNEEYPDGKTSLSTKSFSDDGALLAYGLSYAGSDWMRVRVRRTSDGKDLEGEEVPWVKYSGLTWLKDGSGFLYGRFQPPAGVEGAAMGTETAAARDQELCLHVLGTPVSKDVVVWKDAEHPNWLFGADVTDDGKYVLVIPRDGCDPTNKVYYISSSRLQTWASEVREGRVTADRAPLRRLVDDDRGEFSYIGGRGDRLLFRTNLEAPRFRIVSIDLPGDGDAVTDDEVRAAADGCVEVYPQPAEGGMMDSASLVAGHTVLAINELRDVVSDPYVVSIVLDTLEVGDKVPVHLPAPGSVAGLAGRPEETTLFFGFGSMLHPLEVWSLNLANPAAPSTELVYRPNVPGYDPDAFESWQEFATSADGTKFPLFVARRRDAPKPSKTVLYGYGGFNISLEPAFSPVRLAWLQAGGTYAVANIRGGAEYGEAWHQAGAKHNKLNCFLDFEAAADHLVATGVATTESLAIMGGSNGGLLTLACAQRSPHRFAAAVAAVPVADMLRFHLSTIGSAWRAEYGDPEASAEDFRFLLSYSPYHNVRPPADEASQLPALLVTTADHDDRVSPWHTYKVVAALQTIAGRNPHQKRPILTRIDVDAGHGAGKPTSMVIQEYAQVYAFLHFNTKN